MSTKTFIGYDLGDGESITDYVTMDSGEEFDIRWSDMPMLGMEEGRAVPTTYGYTGDGRLVFFNTIIRKPSTIKRVCVNFKRRPTDLISGLTESSAKYVSLQKIAEEALKKGRWPQEPEFNSRAMLNFRDSVVTFTNSIFENQIYKEKVSSEVKRGGSSEIVFCAGHPTRWNDLDVKIYELIMSQSVLGKGSYAGVRTSLTMSSESRAAYLFIKTPGTSGSKNSEENYLAVGDCALLIDVGSSTIDVTAVTADSNDSVDNYGNNYLGVRCIDFLIRDLYVAKLKEHGDAYSRFVDVVRNNPEYANAIVMACREAKEKLFRNRGIDDYASEDIRGIDSEEIFMSEVENLINTSDVTSVLKSDFHIPEEVIASMKGKSWRTLFKEFLQELKTRLNNKNINVGRIIITGGASWMPVVKETVKSVFSENSDDVILDMDPSRSISKGLALVGPYREKSEMFRKDVTEMLDTKLPEIINKNIPKLAEAISPVISNIIQGIVMKRIREWRAGSITTINGMKAKIESDCSEQNMKQRLESNQAYKEATIKWASDSLGQDIASELNELCTRYKVTGFTLGDLNVFSEIKNLKFDVGMPDIPGLDVLFTIAGLVIGVITAIMLPTIIVVVIQIVAAISTLLASLLVHALLLIPGAGWSILLVVGGIALIYAAIKGAQGAKEMLMEYLSDCDLPLWVRDMMTDEKMHSELKKSNMPEKIRKGLTSDNAARKKISEDISISLRGQVEKKTQEIQYAIESR